MELGEKLSHAWERTKSGAAYAGEVTSVLAKAAWNDPKTAGKCAIAGFVAGTVPLAVDGMENFGDNLRGRPTESKNFEGTSKALTDWMGVDMNDPHQAAACAAGQIPGMVAGAGVTAWALTTATGGAGTAAAINTARTAVSASVASATAARAALATTALIATTVNTTSDVAHIFKPSAPAPEPSRR